MDELRSNLTWMIRYFKEKNKPVVLFTPNPSTAENESYKNRLYHLEDVANTIIDVAEAEDIDKAMKLGANFPMGPLALGDLIGLDVCLAIMETLHREYGEDKYRPHVYLRKMVRDGKLGRKTGEGFFEY